MNTLKMLGFNPANIIDIGCHKGEWTSRTRSKLFPNARYMLIDGEYYPEVDNVLHPSNTNTTNTTNTTHRDIFMLAVLSDQPSEKEWYSIKGTGDSLYQETTRHYSNVKPRLRKVTTLDNLLENVMPQTTIDFIKIDCQGAEIPILKGAVNTLKSVEAILMEMPFVGVFNKGVPSFAEHIAFMDRLGYAPLDIEEVHRPHGIPIQIDLVFVKKSSALLQRIQSIISSF